MLDNLKNASVRDLVDSINKSQFAAIARSSDLRPKLALRLTIPLDTARTAQDPLIVLQPFNGFFVEDCTDGTVEVKLSLGGVDKYATDNYTVIKENDAAYSPDEIKQCCLFWDAQAGKTMVLMFYVGIEYRPGSLLSVVEGGVSIIEGSAVTVAGLGAAGTSSSIAVPAGVATQILMEDSGRKKATLQTDGQLQLGDSVVGETTGLTINPGPFEIRNTGEWWVYSPGGCTITGIVES